MAEWLIEEGIGEHRAIRLDRGTITAARIDWPGTGLVAGQIEQALLVSKTSGSARGLLRFASGEEALVSHLPRDANEGSQICAIVTRAAITEGGRIKRAQARPSKNAPCAAPTLNQRLSSEEEGARIVPRFSAGEWEDVFTQVWAGEIDFSGGAIVITPTPAMTLIDVDGTLQPKALALAAITAIAYAIHHFAIGGSIGIDFPSLADKVDRRAVDQALEEALEGWAHERTAMNGFGFVQLVARLEGPSMLHRINHDRAGAAARFLLRQAEGVAAAGALLLTAHPTVKSATLPIWEAELARRTGRIVRWHTDSTLALNGGFAQAVPL